MPQASEALRKRWNGPSDLTALHHLYSRGFTLTRDWRWVPPPGYRVGEDDKSAMQFLIEEWDFGGMIEAQP